MNKTPEYQTTRIWARTLHTLRLIAATLDESMVAVLDRLVRSEWERMTQEKGEEHATRVDKS